MINTLQTVNLELTGSYMHALAFKIYHNKCNLKQLKHKRRMKVRDEYIAFHTGTEAWVNLAISVL